MTRVLKPVDICFEEPGIDWHSDEPIGLRGFIIEELRDRYVLHDIPRPFSSGTYTIELSKNAFGPGSRSVDRLLLWSSSAQEWHIPSCADYFSIMIALDRIAQTIDPRYSDAYQDIRSIFGHDNVLATSTVVRYRAGPPRAAKGRVGQVPSPLDLVIHNCDTSSPMEISGRISGRLASTNLGWSTIRNFYPLTGFDNLELVKSAVRTVTNTFLAWNRLERSTDGNEYPVVLQYSGRNWRFCINTRTARSTQASARGFRIRDFGEGPR